MFCFFFSEASIPEEFFSLFADKTHLLTAIYNYTSMIPDILLQEIALSSTLKLQNEQNTNAIENCTNAQNSSAVPVVPACPIGTQAPGKLLI